MPPTLSELAKTLNQLAANMAGSRLADPGFERIAGKLVFFPEIAAAFQFLRDRDVLTAADFAELNGVAERAAFTIAGVESRRALQAANELLQQAIAEGWNKQQYTEELAAAFDTLGVTKLSPAHTERVFRTSIAESRSRAHDELLAKPVIGELFPFDRYDAVVDVRSDPSHKVLDNWVFLHEDPIWTSGEFPMRPPRRPNCRCSRTSLSVEEFLDLYRSGAVRYGSGSIIIIDSDGKEIRIARNRGIGSALLTAKIADTGPYSGAGVYRVSA